MDEKAMCIFYDLFIAYLIPDWNVIVCEWFNFYTSKTQASVNLSQCSLVQELTSIIVINLFTLK